MYLYRRYDKIDMFTFVKNTNILFVVTNSYNFQFKLNRNMLSRTLLKIVYRFNDGKQRNQIILSPQLPTCNRSPPVVCRFYFFLCFSLEDIKCHLFCNTLALRVQEQYNFYLIFGYMFIIIALEVCCRSSVCSFRNLFFSLRFDQQTLRHSLSRKK